MTDESGHSGEGEGDSVLVAEYVLGLLDSTEHALWARRIAAEAELAAEVRLWQTQLSSLDSEFAEAAPPPAVWDRLEGRLFTAARPAARWWDSLGLWRGLAGAAAAVALLAVGFDLLQPAQVAPGPRTEFVAGLQPQGGSGVQFVALLDTGRATVTLLGLSGQPVADKDYELWYINGQQAPVSMGIVPAGQQTEVPLDASALGNIGAGTTLAVTLEPKGGSPTGAPTGPIVSAGAASAV